MKKQIILPLLALSLFACGKNEEITLAGSTTVLPIAQKASEAYMDNNPAAKISVSGGGSGVGIAALLDGRTDIADSSRSMTAGEKAAAKAKYGAEPVEIKISRDAIALIVNPKNKVGALSKEQVKNIYTGKVTNWKAVGGDDLKIVVVSRDSSSGTFETFGEKALEGAKVTPDALMQASNQAVSGVVSKTPGAIGYAGIGYLTADTKTVVIDGVTPSEKSARDGSYAYSRYLYMYTAKAPEGEVKKFIDFVLSDDGQKIVKEQGFIPLRELK